MSEPTFVCALCSAVAQEMGHNPEPLRSVQERCCAWCSDNLVTPLRLRRFARGLLPKGDQVSGAMLQACRKTARLLPLRRRLHGWASGRRQAPRW